MYRSLLKGRDSSAFVFGTHQFVLNSVGIFKEDGVVIRAVFGVQFWWGNNGCLQAKKR